LESIDHNVDAEVRLKWSFFDQFNYAHQELKDMKLDKPNSKWKQYVCGQLFGVTTIKVILTTSSIDLYRSL